MLQADLENRDESWALHHFQQRLIRCGLFSEGQLARARLAAADLRDSARVPARISREAPPREAL